MRRAALPLIALAACMPEAAPLSGEFAPFPTERTDNADCVFALESAADAPILVTLADDADQAGYTYFAGETLRIVPSDTVVFGDTLAARYDTFDRRGLESYGGFTVLLNAERDGDGGYVGTIEMDGVSDPVAVVGSCA